MKNNLDQFVCDIMEIYKNDDSEGLKGRQVRLILSEAFIAGKQEVCERIIQADKD